MARRPRRSSSPQRQRDASRIARAAAARSLLIQSIMARPIRPAVRRPRVSLQPVQDLRLWRPGRVRKTARSLRGAPVRGLVATTLSRLAFRNPSRVVLCVRRKVRRQIMFAFGKRGKGSRARRRRTNYYSQVRC